MILSAFIFSSCTKKDDIGKELIELPGDKLGVGFTDTINILTYSERVDSFATSQLRTNMLGSYYDNVMGTTTTGFYTQIRMPSNDLEFGNNVVCDSVVLTLEYAYLYGEDTLTSQNIKIYELDEDMYMDTAYYSNKVFAVKQPEIGNNDVVFNLQDSLYEGENKVHAHLRLKIDNSFGYKILDKSGSTELSDNENFTKFIKGLYVVAEKKNTGGALVGIQLLSAFSRLAIFYHNDEDTLIANFIINENTARVQNFDHDDYVNASGPFVSQVINGDTNLGKQNVYLQPMAAVKSYIKFPYLEKYSDNGPVALNKAELILNVDGLFEDFNGAPPKIALVKKTFDGKLSYLIDKEEGGVYYGGIYDEDKKMYYFTITRHLQSILNGDEKDYGMYVLIEGSGISPKRVVFGGPNNPNGMRLRMYYTKVDVFEN
jgi:hypothetical protein